MSYPYNAPPINNAPQGLPSGPAINPHDVARIATALERIADALGKALEGGVLYTKDADRV